jgi:sulfoxide reductase heme-binding subunit YedZ
MNMFFEVVFFMHDALSQFLAKHLFTLKRLVLVVAHVSFFGILVPPLYRDYGELSANLLIGLLFLSPLARITRMRLLNQMMSLRRELGILMGYLALTHGMGFMMDPMIQQAVFAADPSLALLSLERAYLSGFIALVLTLPLLITSNNIMQSRLGGKNWKRLHRTVYVMFAFAILHRFLWRGESFALVQAAVLGGSYLLVKLYAWRPFFRWPQQLIGMISERYRAYQLQKKVAV